MAYFIFYPRSYPIQTTNWRGAEIPDYGKSYHWLFQGQKIKFLDHPEQITPLLL